MRPELNRTKDENASVRVQRADDTDEGGVMVIDLNDHHDDIGDNNNKDSYGA